ncbi:MAG: hypothetical protein CMP76_07930 [Flavobacterium sp.]|uniref:hypothetical protein n=1 Tax=Flavobacterium sp. TaxID=239 RepID=UPI000C69D55C|nr:hypothetical protein [Flavobacterium sp.]MBF03209.1 hypothetical protein [Flavobacterium sp.]|tara:strand:- start:1406 stop:1795 length:390 start_codon:yes stop_codon:yes gene_type:complete
MINYSLKVKSLKDITPALIKKAIQLTKGIGTISKAPLGSSGQTILLFSKTGSPEITRSSQISVRLYNHDVELLITNKDGYFLFYGRYDYQLGIDFIATEYFRIFKKIGRRNILSSEITKKAIKEIATNE